MARDHNLAASQATWQEAYRDLAASHWQATAKRLGKGPSRLPIRLPPARLPSAAASDLGSSRLPSGVPSVLVVYIDVHV